MRENYRNSIASIKKFPQFTTMHVIDGQAGLIICASLIFCSLTIDNILNIIVLLILAGISISMLSGDNSILQKATDAKQISERAEAKEQAQMDIMAWITDKTANNENSSLDDSKVKTILNGKSYVKNGQPGNESFITAKGEYEIPYSELYTASDTPSTPTNSRVNVSLASDSNITGATTTFTVGDEVTLGGENFFVILDNGTNMKLLAKYCLNRAGTEQVNAGCNTYGRAFSKTTYWSSDFTGNPFDLQSSSMITKAQTDGDVAEGIPNAVLVAQSYGTAKGATGRLMTQGEADAIANGSNQTMKNILYGNWTGEGATTEHSLSFWLGDASNGYDVWNVFGYYSSVSGSVVDDLLSLVGVRPVLEI